MMRASGTQFWDVVETLGKRDTHFLLKLLRGGQYVCCHWQPSCPHEESGWDPEASTVKSRAGHGESKAKSYDVV